LCVCALSTSPSTPNTMQHAHAHRPYADARYGSRHDALPTTHAQVGHGLYSPRSHTHAQGGGSYHPQPHAHHHHPHAHPGTAPTGHHGTHGAHPLRTDVRSASPRTQTGLPTSSNIPSSTGSGSTAAARATSTTRRLEDRCNTVVEERDWRTHLVQQRWRCGKLLGKGGFAKCFEFTNLESGRIVACKVIERSSLTKTKTIQKLQSEIKIHRRMKHPNIVEFIRTFEDSQHVYILLEKCSRQTLMELSSARRRFAVPEVQFFMLQTISACEYMHAENVIHRDLKLGNLMLDEDFNVKVGDFGLAAELSHPEERKRTICGTPNYIAPEILDNKNLDGHSFEVDIWSLGVILYTMLVGQPPFQTDDVKTTYKRIQACKYEFPTNVHVPEAGKNLVHMILQSKPDRRPTLAEIRNHVFFTGAPERAPSSLYPMGERPPAADAYTQHRRFSDAAPPPTACQAWAAGTDVENPRRPLGSLTSNVPRGEGAVLGKGNAQQPTACVPSSYAPTYESAAMRDIYHMPSSRTRSGSVPAVPLHTMAPQQAHNHHHAPQQPATARVTTTAATTTAAGSEPQQHLWREDGVGAHTGGRHHVLSVSPPADSHPAPLPLQAATNDAQDEEDRQHFTQIHDHLHQTLLEVQEVGHTAAVPASQPAIPGPTHWITEYADFSHKYGMAYKLNTGHYGCHFNDVTKMVWESDVTDVVEYISRVKQTTNKGEVLAHDTRISFNMNHPPATPADLQKKITLIKYFKSYLSRAKGRSDGVKVVVPTPNAPQPKQPAMHEPHMTGNMVYVKRWLTTDEAVIFRFSNKTVQVCFHDKTQVTLSSDTRAATYTDAAGIESTFALQSMLHQTPEVAQRLKYTREILYKIINK